MEYLSVRCGTDISANNESLSDVNDSDLSAHLFADIKRLSEVHRHLNDYRALA